MRVRAQGDIRAVVDEQVQVVAAALRGAVERTARSVQTELRDQVSRAGFRRPQSIAAAWRVKVYPENASPTLRPSALVYSRAPKVIEAFDRGTEITVKGSRYLCWPTGFNAALGRRNASGRGGVRVTPEEMVNRNAFLIRWGRGGGFLWCLRTRKGQNTGRRTRTRVFAGDVEVLTSNMANREQRASELLDKGFVPMYFLARTVRPGKRFDVAGAAAKARETLARETAAALGGVR